MCSILSLFVFLNYEETHLDLAHMLRLKPVWKMLVSKYQTLDFPTV